MVSGKILYGSFFIGLGLGLFGAARKIMHAPGADTFMTLGLIFSLIFIVTALYEIHRSNRLTATEKLTWTVAMIFFNGIAGLVYLLAARKRIVSA